MTIEDAMNMSIEDRVAWFRRDLAANPLTTAVMMATADLRFLLDAIDAQPSVRPPTREQIAEALYRAKYPFANLTFAHESGIERRRIFAQADAVLALFQQPTPSSEPMVPAALIERAPHGDDCWLREDPDEGVLPELRKCTCWKAQALASPNPNAGRSDRDATNCRSGELHEWKHVSTRVDEVPMSACSLCMARRISATGRVVQPPRPAEPVSIADMAPGTTACADPNVNRWYCLRESDGTCPVPKCGDPSRIRDVPPPPATPEEGA
jgi:hypothetical protein